MDAETKTGPIRIAWPNGDVWEWAYKVKHEEHATYVREIGWRREHKKELRK